MVGLARERIRYYIIDSMLVLEVKVVFLQQLHPAGLTTSEFRLCWKMAEGCVIRIYDEVGSVQIVSPGSEGMNNSK